MKREIFHVIVAILAGIGMGFLFMAVLPPTPVVAPPPTPAVAPPDRDLVVGLSTVLVDVHAEAVATRKELAGVKAEVKLVANLLAAGYLVRGYNRSAGRGAALVDAGMQLAPTPAASDGVAMPPYSA